MPNGMSRYKDQWREDDDTLTPYAPSREFLDEKERQRASVRALERRDEQRKRDLYEKRKARLYRAGGVVGRNGVWSCDSTRSERSYTVHVFPDQRGESVGWAGICDCQAIAQCWHKDAAVEREIEYLEDIRAREGWGYERIDTPLVPLSPPLFASNVETLGGGYYRVPSDTTPGIIYNVQIVEGVGVCDCLSDAAECKHIQRAKELGNE